MGAPFAGSWRARALRRALLLALGLVLALGGCGDRTDQPSPEPVGPLPADPKEWICEGGKPVTEADIGAWCRAHPDRGQPLPVDLRNPPPPTSFFAYQAYNVRLEKFLTGREYESLGWVHDMNWRFSGPSVLDASGTSFANNYGPHFPLRVYYSPEVVDWLCGGRQGEIPDGAMIMKAMSIAWTKLDIRQARDGCMDIVDDPGDPIAPSLWAPMIKTSQSSYDGWYWTLQQPDLGLPPQFPPPLLDQSAFTGGPFGEIPAADNPAWYPTGSSLQQFTKLPNVVELIPLAGHPYCLSCHSTAVSESSFASMDNILGRELRYKAFTPVPGPSPAPPGSLQPFPPPLVAPQQAFLEAFHQMAPVGFPDVWQTRMPASTYDQQVISAHDGPGQFLTSAQCFACHNATPQSPLFPQMVLLDDPPWLSSPLRNLSPAGEWQVSPMALSGRDPLFFAQLQGETNHLAQQTDCIENTCLHCHGVMGAREFNADTAPQGAACEDMFAIPPPPEVPSGQPFRRAALQQWLGSKEADQQYYGALARDGVSCTVCHHVDKADLGQERTYTGNFVSGPADELNGPYPDATIVTKPMQHALGVTPKFGAQIADSELCGTCHNILLPVFANDGRRLGASYEQSTELEWSNSDYARSGGDEFRSCQDCHMPTTYKGKSLAFKIANSETDLAFPPTTNRLPDDEIALTQRDRFSRHALHGVNVFLNQFFQQFPLVLGFQQIDWMSEQPSSLDPPAPPFAQSYLMELPLITGFESMLEMAQQQTATVAIEGVSQSAQGIDAVVKVANQAGHELPTGVGFRRAFLEVLVLDAQNQLLWASGRTNDLGFILDGVTDQVLESEQPGQFPDVPPQPHYQVVDAGNQVQIYQELIEDSAGALTTSFLRRVKIIKDNRIRPEGFDPEFFARSDSPYIRELALLHGAEAQDPYYTDPKLTGADEIEYRIPLTGDALQRADHVQVTLYYQSIPPSYLQERFADAAQGPAKKDDIQRLYYLTSHLNVDGAISATGEPVLAGWKLRITGATSTIR